MTNAWPANRGARELSKNPFSPHSGLSGLMGAFAGSQPAGIGSKSALPFGVGLLGGIQPKASANALLGLPFAPIARRKFTDAEKIAVWQKGKFPLTLSPADWRWDESGNLIHWYAYGDANSEIGWEIDHIKPLALGGSNDISNLRPLRCAVNRGLGAFVARALA